MPRAFLELELLQCKSHILNQRLSLIKHAQQQSAGIYAGGRFRQLSVGFVVGLAGIARLFAGVAPVVRLGAGLVMSPGGLVEDRKSLEGLAGQGLITQQQKWK